MWEKLIAGASTAFFTVAVAVLERFESTPTAAALALFGAALAMIEAETRHWGTRAMVLMFNLIIGILGGSAVAMALRERAEIEAPSILVLSSLAIAYLAHDVFGGVKVVVASRIARFLRGKL